MDAAKAEAVARQAASQVAAGDAAVGVLEKEAQAKHEAAAAMHSAVSGGHASMHPLMRFKHAAATILHRVIYPGPCFLQLVYALETKEKLHALNPLHPMHTGASTALTQNQNGAAATEAA